MSESEFPIVVHGTTVEKPIGGPGEWSVDVGDDHDGFTIAHTGPLSDAGQLARDAAALLRRTVERATADLQADLAEAQADRDRMGAILAEDFPRIKSIVFPDPGGALAMQFTPTWMLGLLAHTFGELLGEAPNYVELRATHREHGPLLFTIQRAGGTTPHDGRVAAESRCANLQARLDAALAFADPVTQKALLAALSPEAIEAYLSAHGWAVANERSTFREWCVDNGAGGAAVPLRVDFRDYVSRVADVLKEIEAFEGRPAVAVYLDMVAK